MKLNLHSPLPANVEKECWKCAEIIEEFIKPNGKGPDKLIPPDIIANCRGVAVMTVLKGGFLWTGRGGAGLVVAKLPDGTWSAPSAIATGGIGFGGQLGVEVTDFVMILNTDSAVRAFSMGGNFTLGGNVSVAAGPVGRSVEAGGAVGHMAPIYSYSKTKGLFVGISLEGSVIVERKKTNAAFYGRAVPAHEILSGQIPRPPAADRFYRALDARSFISYSPSLSRNTLSSNNYPTEAPPLPTRRRSTQTCTALYDFTGERPTDLTFQKGDVIEVVSKDGDAWWTGTLNGIKGSFPSNYVVLQ